MNFNNPFAATEEPINRLHDEATRLKDNIVSATRHQVIEPAMHAAEKAGTLARDAYHDTRETMSKEIALAVDLAVRQRDVAARWVSANPLTAIAIAFAVGALLTQAGRGKSSR